jgi:outer membrane cobalamin receptor
MTAVGGVLSPFITLFFLTSTSPSFPASGSPPGAPAPADPGDEIPTYRLPPVVVEAPRLSPVPLFPGARTVLDHEWLTRRDPADLGAALVSVAGLRVFTLGDGESRAVSVRGMGPDRTAVLVDGQLRNTAQGGGVDLGSMDLDGVERIEVARGAMGALYGPYALGGAVQVVSRRDRETATSLRLLAGTQDRTLLHARGGWGRNRLSASAELGLQNAAPDLDGTRSRSETRNGVLRAGFYPTWASTIDLSLEGNVDERDVPGSRAFPTPEARRRDALGQATVAAHGLRVLEVPGMFEASLSAFRFDRRFTDPGYTLGAVDDTHRNDRTSFTLGWRNCAPSLTTSLRAEAVHDRLESTTDGEHARDRGAVAGLVEAQRGDWNLSGATRLDAVQGFSPEATGRAGIARTVWGARGGERWISLRLGAGTGFRPPTFDDLFWPARATAAGNPDLLPEHSWDLDFGLEAQAGRSRLQVSAYHADVLHLIQWVPGPEGAWRPHNLGRARLRGVEVEGTAHGSIAGGEVFLDAALSRLEARDATDDRTTAGKQLVGRAAWIGSGALSWHPGALGLSMGFRGLDRVPLTAANTKWLAGYVLWDASVSWRVSPGLRFELEGRNLFDTDYQDLRGYATAGREVLLSIQLRSGTGDR